MSYIGEVDDGEDEGFCHSICSGCGADLCCYEGCECDPDDFEKGL